jgi:imidazolonepropionase-like amidohydrolase
LQDEVGVSKNGKPGAEEISHTVGNMQFGKSGTDFCRIQYSKGRTRCDLFSLTAKAMLNSLCVLVATALTTAEPAPPDTVLVINHVTVVDVVAGVSRPDQDVVIRGTQIELIAPARQARSPRAARIVNGNGKYLIPGLWDMHVHTGGDERTLQSLLASGITGVRDMGGDLRKLSEARRRIVSGQLKGPRLVFAGPTLRGPRSSSDTSDAESLVIRTAEEASTAVDSLLAQGADFVKVHEELSREAFSAIVAAARARQRQCVGHVPASLTPQEVSDLGVLSIEHLEFVPDSCLVLFNDEAAAAGARPEVCGPLALSSLLQRLAKNDTSLEPTIGSFRYWAPMQWDSILAGFRNIAGAIRRSGVRVLAGTDWSSSLQSRGAPLGGSLHDELALLVQAGFSPAEALRAATSNPASFLGVSKTLGTVEAGKIGDLVMLDGDPLSDIRNTRRVAAVLREGQFLRVRDGSLVADE